jgi:hypothetical protein
VTLAGARGSASTRILRPGAPPAKSSKVKIYLDRSRVSYYKFDTDQDSRLKPSMPKVRWLEKAR